MPTNLRSRFVLATTILLSACNSPNSSIHDTTKESKPTHSAKNESKVEVASTASGRAPDADSTSIARTGPPDSSVSATSAAATRAVDKAVTTAPKNAQRGAMNIPDSTTPANRDAFLALALGKDDSEPLAGVGENGIHLTVLKTGTDVKKGQCLTEKSQFVVGTDDKASVCMRIVHAELPQKVTVIWERPDGKWTPPQAELDVPAQHSFHTRAYVPMRPAMVGSWRARIVSADQVELGAIAFEIADATNNQ
jgi:hypothetical protein